MLIELLTVGGIVCIRHGDHGHGLAIWSPNYGHAVCESADAEHRTFNRSDENLL